MCWSVIKDVAEIAGNLGVLVIGLAGYRYTKLQDRISRAEKNYAFNKSVHDKAMIYANSFRWIGDEYIDQAEAWMQLANVSSEARHRMGKEVGDLLEETLSNGEEIRHRWNDEIGRELEEGEVEEDIREEIRADAREFADSYTEKIEKRMLKHLVMTK